MKGTTQTEDATGAILSLVTVAKYGLGKTRQMLEQMLDDITEQLESCERILTKTQEESPYHHLKQGSAAHSEKMSKALNSYWAKMKPEARSAEMKRRQAIAKRRREGVVESNAPRRMSTAGLKKGSAAFKKVDAYNKRMITREKAEARINGAA